MANKYTGISALVRQSNAALVIGNTTPASMSTKQDGEISLANMRHVFLQVDLTTTDPLGANGSKVYFRVALAADATAAAALDPSSKSLANGFATQGQVVELWLEATPIDSGGNIAYFMWALTDSTGAADTGGADDRIHILAEK